MSELIQKTLLELVSPSNNKFYEMTIMYHRDRPVTERFTIETRWGKRLGDWKHAEAIGTRKRFKACRTQRNAENLMNEQLRGKKRKGYVEVKIRKKKKVTIPEDKTLEEASLERFSLMADDL